MSFPCPTFCPEVPAQYQCVITSESLLWAVSGSVSGSASYDENDNIGRIKQLGSFFTANKTGSNSFSLNFIADVEFNSSVIVRCQDLTDTNSVQCTIEIEGKNIK